MRRSIAVSVLVSYRNQHYPHPALRRRPRSRGRSPSIAAPSVYSRKMFFALRFGAGAASHSAAAIISGSGSSSGSRGARIMCTETPFFIVLPRTERRRLLHPPTPIYPRAEWLTCCRGRWRTLQPEIRPVRRMYSLFPRPPSISEFDPLQRASAAATTPSDMCMCERVQFGPGVRCTASFCSRSTGGAARTNRFLRRIGQGLLCG